MPKYAALIYGSAEDQGPSSPEVLEQVMADYTEFGEKAGAAGVIAGGEALHDTDTATTIQVKGGKGGDAVFTDGPFAETKEVLGGFYILDVADLDEALKWAQQIPGAWHGKVEVRPIMEFDTDSPDA
ncbi:MAG TPA: YciI family protein [Acidimicrobiia bacterium]|nr:YciI family protein [Acidimicrobiia bacterium]